MDLFVFAQERAVVVRNGVSAFWNDVSRLLRASPIFGGAVVGTGIVLGFGPILLWQFFGKFIDACFAARGVGTITSDLSHSAIILGGIAVLVAVALGYFAQTKALSRSIASTIGIFAIVATHVIALLPIEKSFVVFLAILTIGFSVARHRAVTITIGVVLALLTVSTISDLLFMMTRRSMTVGSAIEYCAVVIMLGVVVGWKHARTPLAKNNV